MINFINVGPQGSFKQSGKINTTASDIDLLFKELGKNCIKTLVIYFHGGLVSEQAGLATAQTISHALRHQDIHVITFVWETGLGETIQRNLSTVTSTKFFTTLRDIVIEKACKTLGISDGNRGNTPISKAELSIEFQKEQPLQRFEGNARGGAQNVSETSLPNIEIELQEEVAEDLAADTALIELATQEQATSNSLDPKIVPPQISSYAVHRGVITFTLIKSIASVVIRVIRRFINKTDHGLYPTIVEEILRQFYIADFGQWVWGGMKEIAEKGMWLPNNHQEEEENKKVGTYFFERLVDHRQKYPNLSVDLVGHSAGSIAICHLLKNVATWEHNLFPFRNIVLLAPACTSQLFFDEIVQHPERYMNLRMFTMTDEYECQDQLVNRLYTRSLLYLVSGNFEGEDDMPIVGMHRYLTIAEPYVNDPILAHIRAFFMQPDANRLVLSVSDEGALSGFQTDSLKHGDFDNNPATLASLSAIVAG